MSSTDTIETVNCPSCDCHHTDVAITAYKTPKPPATHWYICPTTKDPVDISIIELSSSDKVVLSAGVLAMLSQAIQSGRFMVCSWHIQPATAKLKEQVVFNRTCAAFPVVEYRTAIKQIIEDLTQKENADLGPKVLELATPVKPLVDLFGQNDSEQAESNESPLVIAVDGDGVLKIYTRADCKAFDEPPAVGIHHPQWGRLCVEKFGARIATGEPIGIDVVDGFEPYVGNDAGNGTDS